MSRRARGQSGAAAVELALLLPLLIAILAGVLDLGNAALVRARIQDAVEEGTMQAARTPGNPTAAKTRTVEASNGVLKAAEVSVSCAGVDVQVVARHDHALLTGFLPFLPNPIKMEIGARSARLTPAPCVAS
jgi:Flp pilus assembly protein TadG